MIAAIRVRRGDIVITRSGTIGRVAYITRRLHNVIVSDDLIRVRVEDEELRFYIFAYLQSKYAQDQMSRNEYGAVQQHLEPEHIRNILVPVADNRSHMADIVDGVRLSIELRERLEAENGNTSAKMDGLIKAALEGI
jgi:restriction endonuclease S subunit